MNYSIVSFVILIIKNSVEADNHFIVDYFKYKKASRVVGFSCNYIDGKIDFLILK